MKSDSVVLYTSIKSSLLKKTLFRGTAIAAIGMLVMFYGYLHLDVPTLSFWGLPIFFLSMGLIALGMVPYRKLSYLEKNPNQLTITSQKNIIYEQKGRKIFTIPFEAIEKIDYNESSSIYGIKLILNNHPSEKVIIHDRSFDFQNYRKYCENNYQCDLFLPYFSQRSKSLIEQYRAF